MSGHEQPLISVLVPARNEERTLPTTLPAILKAARELPHPAEVLVITPPDSPAYAAPPLCDPILTWLPTPRSGKFNALRIGADASQGEFLLLVDADVVMDTDTLRILAEPMLSGSADVVAGRIALLPFATRGPEQLFERWALLSFRTWHELRSHHPDLLWALPGAIYAIRRALFPAEPLVPIVDDAVGAAIVFHGDTWHGAYSRTSPGLRLTLATLFCRMYMRPQERYDEIIGDQVLDRNPPRFRTLVGKDVPTGWRSVAEAERILELRKMQAPAYYRTRSEHA
jgi:Glycosyl transferase family 2